MDQPSFAFAGNDWQVVFVLSLVTIGFIIFWFTSESVALKEQFFRKYTKEKAGIRWVLIQKYTGAFFLGVIPLFLSLLFLPFSLQDYGLGFQNTLISLMWIGGLAAIIFPMNIRAAKRPPPQIALLCV